VISGEQRLKDFPFVIFHFSLAIARSVRQSMTHRALEIAHRVDHSEMTNDKWKIYLSALMNGLQAVNNPGPL